MATTIKKRPRNGFPSLCKQLGASNSASVLTERGQTIFQLLDVVRTKLTLAHKLSELSDGR